MKTTATEKGAHVILAEVPGVGPKRISLLVEAFGSAEAALHTRPGLLSALPGIGPELATAIREAGRVRDPGEVIHGTEQAGVSIVLRDDAEYPEPLRHIHNPPLLLYVRGRLSTLAEASIAVVGARNCTERGRWVAERLAEGLAGQGVCVVSGLARGIDAAAHRGALRTGRTVAVLGNGVDIVYPACNSALTRQVLANGAVVSEYPLGTEPRPGHFPARNRIISGLSLGTVVVEAGERSGAMITAAFAVQQDREVFAVPGDTRSPGSRGPHRLIKEGAKLVETVNDILEEFAHLGYLPPGPGSPLRGSVTPVPNGRTLSRDPASAVRELLADGPLTLDEIAERVGLGAGEVAATLTLLELDGLVCLRPGGRYGPC